MISQGFLQAQNDNHLEVKIKNIDLLEGQLYLSITSDSALFPYGVIAEENLRKAQITAHEMTLDFVNLPDGEYAIALVQDLNGNGKMDTKKFGIPAEPFAFSNAALRKFGPPFFEQAKFEIRGGGKHIHELVMIYKKPKKKDKK